MSEAPGVGTAVHYVSHGTPIRPDGTQAYTSQCRAADITEVDAEAPELVGVLVKNPTGLFFHPLAGGGCEYDAGDPTSSADWSCDGLDHQGGTWHVPVKVEA